MERQTEVNENRVQQAYEICLGGVVRAHRQRAWDRPTTEEEDAELEREYDEWRFLPDHLGMRINNLSGDLYSVIEEEIRRDSHEFAALADKRAAFQTAHAAKDWDRCLEILRDGEPLMDAASLAETRGKIWLELGRPDVAKMFLDFAAARRITNGSTVPASDVNEAGPRVR